MVKINIFGAERQTLPICWLFGRMDTGVPHEEDCSALLPDGGAGSDHCVEVGESFLGSLQAQKWSVGFCCELLNLFRVLKVEDHQEYLVKQPLANSECCECSECRKWVFSQSTSDRLNNSPPTPNFSPTFKNFSQKLCLGCKEKESFTESFIWI